MDRIPNSPPDFGFPATSATQQQAPSQATAGPPAYPLAHPGLPGLESYSHQLQQSAFNPMEMPAHAPEQPSFVPNAVSFAPEFHAPLQGWAQGQNPYGFPAGGQAAFPQGDHPTAPQGGTAAMPMDASQGFVADPGHLPQAHGLTSSYFRRQQARYLASHSRSAPPGDPSATPAPGKRALTGAEATDARRTKRASVGKSAGTASVDAPTANPGSAPSASAPRKKGHNAHEIAERAKKYKENAVQSTYQFAKENAMNACFQNNKKILNALGIEHAFEMNEVLLACEKAVGGSPADDEYNLTLERNGNTAQVFWRIEDHKTTLMSIAPDAEQLKRKVERTKKAAGGRRMKALADAGVTAHMNIFDIRKIKNRPCNERILTELGYKPEEHGDAVRTLSMQCDSILGAQRAGGAAPQDGSVFDTDIPGVQRFKFTRFGPQGKEVQGLRWVEDTTLRQLLLFKEGERDEALKTMRRDIASWQSQRDRAQLRASMLAEDPNFDNGLTSASDGNISKRHRAALTAMGWTDVQGAINTLADLCEITARTPQAGNIFSDTSLPDVQYFNFPQGGPEGGMVEVLRWKIGDKVCDIRPIEDGNLEDALKKTEDMMRRSLAQQGERNVPPPAEGGASA